MKAGGGGPSPAPAVATGTTTRQAAAAILPGPMRAPGRGGASRAAGSDRLAPNPGRFATSRYGRSLIRPAFRHMAANSGLRSLSQVSANLYRTEASQGFSIASRVSAVSEAYRVSDS